LRRLLGIFLCRLQPLMPRTITIGTRGSKLALWQADWVKSSLQSTHPSLPVDIVIIKTKGDKILDVPLAKVGGKGLFVKEIEEALLDGRIDLAVHSMKDMPSVIPPGLCIGAVPDRETHNDVIVSKSGSPFAELVSGAKIGTSSLRRAAQLRHARPDIEIVPLRGNLDTRLLKVQAGNLDAIVVAAAGMKRLKMTQQITEYLDESIMLPAVAQGALCVETRDDDTDTRELIKKLDHPETRAAVLGERAFLSRLGGSCQVPIAGYGKRADDRYVLKGLVADPDGSVMIKDALSGDMAQTEQIGTALAEQLLARGAGEILEKLMVENP